MARQSGINERPLPSGRQELRERSEYACNRYCSKPLLAASPARNTCMPGMAVLSEMAIAIRHSVPSEMMCSLSQAEAGGDARN